MSNFRFIGGARGFIRQYAYAFKAANIASPVEAWRFSGHYAYAFKAAGAALPVEAWGFSPTNMSPRNEGLQPRAVAQNSQYTPPAKSAPPKNLVNPPNLLKTPQPQQNKRQNSQK